MSSVIKIKTKPLHEWQQKVIDIYKQHPKNSIILIKSGRQRGKSYTIIILALYECINNHNQTCIIICPSYNLARKQFNDFSKAIKQLPITQSLNSSYLEITLTNGSVIKFKSAESRDNLRGETANLLIFDEGAFINLDTAMECFNYTNTTNGNIIIASTPKFKDDNNLFYKYYKEAIEGRNNCYLIDFNEYDTTSMLSVERMEMYKNTMPFNIYCNEILGEFLQEKSNVFGDFGKVVSNYVHPYTQCYAGIDFATGVNADETAVAIFNENKKMVGLIHFNDVDTNETVVKVINILQSYKVSKAVIETNSIGKVYFDLMKEKINLSNLRTQLIAFNTTNKSKREIIQNLQLHIQNETISLLDDMTLKLQLANFEIKSTPSGLITYGNSSDTIHDDTVISTALALHAFKSGGYYCR
jgi:hypothetical protein